MPAELVSCPECQRKLRVPPELIGKLVKCPTCSHTFTADLARHAAPPEPESAPVAVERPLRTSKVGDDVEDEDRSRRRPRREDDDDDDRPRRRSRRQREDDNEDEDGPRRRSRFERDDHDEDDDYRRRPSPATLRDFAGKKVAAGICGILLGHLGIHKFILGLNTPGIIMLLVSLLGGLGLIGGCICVVPFILVPGWLIMGIIGFIEGIIYLTKSDQDFYRTYAIEKRGWF
jgi:predicted Zn finger-like uncharacterized protein